LRNLDRQVLIRRPLSSLAAILALLIILYEVFDIARGELYQPALYFIDGTTLIELGILMLLGVVTLRDQTDLQAVSFTLVAGLSFIFIYEAIFKWSFYLAPFRLHMPAPEFREFVIQLATAATILTGFANGFFTLKKWTVVWLGLFVALWILWLLVGFPQITGEVILPRVIPIDFTHSMTYILNRCTKAVLFLAYLTVLPPLRSIHEPASLDAHSTKYTIET
jgi:hypothetical protein